jgi:multiple sugar transport system substrate-binding protein
MRRLTVHVGSRTGHHQPYARNKLAALSLAALTAGGAAGLGVVAPAAASNSPISFTYWTSGFQPAEIATIDSAFDKAYPAYQATGQLISGSDEYLPKLIAALKTNTGPTVYTDQQPYDLPIVQESGKLIPLTGKLTGLTNQLYPGIKSSLFYRGQQLGMALGGVGDIALFYNKTDFAQAGISSPPTTWSQLVTDAVKLTDPSAKRWGFYVPTGDAEWISYDWEPVLWGDGGSLLNANQTTATFDSAAGVKALSTWVNMVRSQKVAPTASYAADGNFDGPTAFASNAVAMTTDGPWLENELPSGFNYGVAPYPAGTEGESTNIIIGGVDALLKTTPAQDKAGLAFIRFLASPPEGAYLTQQSGSLPSSPLQLNQPSLQAAETNQWYGVFANDLKYGQVRPITPQYPAISTDLWTEINAAIAGSVSPKQALSIAAQEADKALEEGTTTTSSSTTTSTSTTSTSTTSTTSQTAGPTIQGSYAIVGSGGQFTWSVQSSTPINDVLITVPANSPLFLTAITGPSGWVCSNNLPSPAVGTSPTDILCSGSSMMTDLSGTIGYSPADGDPAPVMASGSINGVQGPTVTLTSTG